MRSLIFFVRHSEFENFFLCERILSQRKCHNLSKRNVKLILKILRDLKPLRESSNKKKPIIFKSFVCNKLGSLWHSWTFKTLVLYGTLFHEFVSKLSSLWRVGFVSLAF
jgi:hypothetical protein